MTRFRDWVRTLGGAGAVSNASLACQQRRDEEAVIEARLDRIADAAPAPATKSSSAA